MSKQKKGQALLSEDSNGSSLNQSVVNEEAAIKGINGKSVVEEKQSNTIMQQINNFAKIPMNDKIGDQTIEDHKYLLELVENKCAIAFYACVNRNLSLYNALTNYLTILESEDDAYNKRQAIREKENVVELKFK